MKFKKIVIYFVFISALISTLLNVLTLFSVIQEAPADIGLIVVFAAALLYAIGFMTSKVEREDEQTEAEKPDTPLSKSIGLVLMFWLISFVIRIFLL